MRATELQNRFRVPGVEFAETETEHGLVRAQVALDGMTGELFLQGAQVTQWQPPGQSPVIFTSPDAAYAPGKAIRGGVPVIFPWFGPHPTDPKQPQHGFARTADWRLDAVESSGSAVTFTLSLTPDDFTVTYRASFGKELQLELAVRNRSTRDFEFEEALHTYFAVSDVEKVSVSGLEGSIFIDKTAGMQRRPRPGSSIASAPGTSR